MNFFMPSFRQIQIAFAILIILLFLPIVPQNYPLHPHGGGLENHYGFIRMTESIVKNFILPFDSFLTLEVAKQNRNLTLLSLLAFIIIAYSASYGIEKIIKKQRKNAN